jgi:lipopolysaccharide/colanic/teichoic acid biosynthesis glycosyltransferase
MQSSAGAIEIYSSKVKSFEQQRCVRCASYLDSSQKRVFDVVFCLILLVPGSLLLFLAFLWVLIVDGSPAIFCQKRTGKNGVPFTMPKVRTLKKGVHPDTPSYAYDLREFMFPLSKFLRKSRLDELPQLFSVLSGDMTLVGPRPELVPITENYSPKQMKRLCTKPGLTGLWQIRASRQKPIHQSMQYDLYYIRQASFWLDLKILAETFFFLLKV